MIKKAASAGSIPLKPLFIFKDDENDYTDFRSA